MNSPGSAFLHERNPDFHKSQEVELVTEYLRNNGESIPNQPSDKITSYLGFLANREYVNDGILTGDRASLERQTSAHVINGEDVPEGYFTLQNRIAREQGRGETLFSSQMRSQMTETLQADQRAGLSKWGEYLSGEDGGYPDWFKTFAWTSVTKLGAYDKEKVEFQKRSRGTTAPFPELNREALAYVYDVLDKSRVQGKNVNEMTGDVDLRKLINGANFGKLYARAVLMSTPQNPESLSETIGSWTKFNQSDDPRTAQRLASSIQGHGTGWCTAGETTAATQLSTGDFYVYYSQDEDGKDTIPRIAIRMEHDQVAEVRGVNPGQELESDLADTAVEQLSVLPGGEEYIIKAEDMKTLTALAKKTESEPHTILSTDEIRFLYQIDREIKGFSYDPDPRIREIIAARGNTDDVELARVMPECIREQFQSSYSAYQEISEQLGIEQTVSVKLQPAEVESLFAAKETEWYANGTFDYLVEQLKEYGTRHTLVITPEVDLNSGEILSLAETFGKGQPLPLDPTVERATISSFDGQALSGKHIGSTAKFTLIPSAPDSEMSYERLDEQVKLLRARQADNPELNARVPNLLEAVAHWYCLRARGDKLNDFMTNDKTAISHFDLEPIVVEGHKVLPLSIIGSDGRPGIYLSETFRPEQVKIAVG